MPVQRKDYSEYINQQFGELTILSVSEPNKEKNYERFCKCKCSCGKEATASLHNVLRGRTTSCGHAQIKNRTLSRNLNPNCSIDNKSTGIKNISFNKRDYAYQIRVTRNHVRRIGHAFSIEEAIEIKERFLQELDALD